MESVFPNQPAIMFVETSKYLCIYSVLRNCYKLIMTCPITCPCARSYDLVLRPEMQYCGLNNCKNFELNFTAFSCKFYNRSV